MPKSILVVFSNPSSPAEDERYNQWYSDKHLVDVVGVPGFVGATRYKLDKGVTMSGGAVPPNSAGYLAIYELEADTTEGLQAASDALALALQDGSVDMDPSLDGPTIEASFAVPITDYVS